MTKHDYGILMMKVNKQKIKINTVLQRKIQYSKFRKKSGYLKNV
jgi:hypothetical protein